MSQPLLPIDIPAVSPGVNTTTFTDNMRVAGTSVVPVQRWLFSAMGCIGDRGVRGEARQLAASLRAAHDEELREFADNLERRVVRIID